MTQRATSAHATTELFPPPVVVVVVIVVVVVVVVVLVFGQRPRRGR